MYTIEQVDKKHTAKIVKISHTELNGTGCSTFEYFVSDIC